MSNERASSPRHLRRARVLIVDDQRAMAEMLADGLADQDYETVVVDRGDQAIEALESDTIDAVVTDLRMSPVDGFAVLAASRRLDRERPVVIMTAYSAVDSAIEAIRQGAYHYLAKPFLADELSIFLARGIAQCAAKRQADAMWQALGDDAPSGVVASSPAMHKVMQTAARIAASDAPVLILGETGTGKGRVAAAIHARRGKERPFVAVNCAAVPEQLLESELFGHVKGAFTGATSARAGLITAASGGTLFLDEIGDMPLALQAKLLRALEQGRVRPIGADREHEVDVRLIAATHRDLHALVETGQFRSDLLYRIEVLSLTLPPLRERTQDIPALLECFLEESRARYPSAPAQRFGREAAALLLAHPWPGNVRELAHAVERMVLLAPEAEVRADDVTLALRLDVDAKRRPLFRELLPMRELQRAYAAWACEQLGGNRTRTAEQLGIDYKTLMRLLEPTAGSKP